MSFPARNPRDAYLAASVATASPARLLRDALRPTGPRPPAGLDAQRRGEPSQAHATAAARPGDRPRAAQQPAGRRLGGRPGTGLALRLPATASWSGPTSARTSPSRSSACSPPARCATPGATPPCSPCRPARDGTAMTDAGRRPAAGRPCSTGSSSTSARSERKLADPDAPGPPSRGTSRSCRPDPRRPAPPGPGRCWPGSARCAAGWPSRCTPCAGTQALAGPDGPRDRAAGDRSVYLDVDA